jgi:hypothetical protein
MNRKNHIIETRKTAVPTGNGGFAPSRSASVGR